MIQSDIYTQIGDDVVRQISGFFLTSLGTLPRLDNQKPLQRRIQVHRGVKKSLK